MPPVRPPARPSSQRAPVSGIGKRAQPYGSTIVLSHLGNAAHGSSRRPIRVLSHLRIPCPSEHCCCGNKITETICAHCRGSSPAFRAAGGGIPLMVRCIRPAAHITTKPQPSVAEACSAAACVGCKLSESPGGRQQSPAARHQTGHPPEVNKKSNGNCTICNRAGPGDKVPEFIPSAFRCRQRGVAHLETEIPPVITQHPHVAPYVAPCTCVRLRLTSRPASKLEPHFNGRPLRDLTAHATTHRLCLAHPYGIDWSNPCRRLSRDRDRPLCVNVDATYDHR